MHLLKCENGHIYDTDKFRSCPHCFSIPTEYAAMCEGALENQSEVDTEIPEEKLRSQYEKLCRRKVVGMLVCVEGDMQGEGFLLREGENVIGRASNMDVALTQESTVSRKHHASIVCDVKEWSYTLTVKDAKKGVLVNGQGVEQAIALKNHDQLQLGDCKLIFVEAGEIWKG